MIGINASIGIKPFDTEASADDILRRADSRMYEMKRGRRGKVPHLRAVG